MSFCSFHFKGLKIFIVTLDVRPLWEKQDHNSTDRDQFPRKRLSILTVKQITCTPNYNMVFVTCPRLHESIGIFRNAWKNIYFIREKNLPACFSIIFLLKRKMHMNVGRGLRYLIINEMYFVAGICQTTWSNSSYQEYLQISLRCSPCKYHSLRTCVASLRNSTLISRRVWNVTLSETMKVVKLNR